MASYSPSALPFSSNTRVGLPVPLALRQRPVPVPRVAALAGGQFGPIRPELAAVSRPGVRGRVPLFRPRAWMTTSQIVSCAITWGTIAVFPCTDSWSSPPTPTSQVYYHDGIKNKVDTRHSVSLCLLFCPVGILRLTW